LLARRSRRLRVPWRGTSAQLVTPAGTVEGAFRLAARAARFFPRGWDLRHSPASYRLAPSRRMFVPAFAQVCPSLRDVVPALVPVRWDLAPRIGAILTLDGTREVRPVGEMSTRSSLGAFCRSSGTKHGAARADVGVDLRACPERLPGRTWRAPRLTATPTGWPQPDRESRR
jgi:hypothetical protein